MFKDSDLNPGVHINGIGSYTPQMQEIPAGTVIRSKVIVDSRQAALVEAGDLVIPIAGGLISDKHIHGEIGELAAGKIPGRESEDEMTFFKSVGLASYLSLILQFLRVYRCLKSALHLWE